MYIGIYDIIQARNYVAGGNTINDVVESLRETIEYSAEEPFDFERISFYEDKEIKVKEMRTYSIIIE